MNSRILHLIATCSPATFAVTAVTALSACSYSVTGEAAIDIGGTLRFQLDRITETCDGGDTIEDEQGGITVYTETAVEGGCRIDFTWRGPLVDMPLVRSKVEEELENDMTIEDVELTVMRLTVEDVELADRADRAITPPVIPSFDAVLVANDQEVAHFSETDANALLAGPFDIELPQEVIDLANSALRQQFPLQAQASGHIVIPNDYLPGIVGQEPRLFFDLSVHVEADITKEII